MANAQEFFDIETFERYTVNPSPTQDPLYPRSERTNHRHRQQAREAGVSESSKADLDRIRDKNFHRARNRVRNRFSQREAARNLGITKSQVITLMNRAEKFGWKRPKFSGNQSTGLTKGDLEVLRKHIKVTGMFSQREAAQELGISLWQVRTLMRRARSAEENGSKTIIKQGNFLTLEDLDVLRKFM